MDRRERVIAAIQHKDTDIVPYWADFTGIEEEKMIKYTGNPEENVMAMLDVFMNQ